MEFTTPIKAVVKTDPFSKLFLTFFEPFPNAAENIYMFEKIWNLIYELVKMFNNNNMLA